MYLFTYDEYLRCTEPRGIYEEGRAQGIAEGEKIGEKRGEKIGIAKAIKQMVKEMLQKQMSDEDIIDITKIDEKELQKLKMA